MDNWVVLFVRTGSEEKVVNILKLELDSKLFDPFLLKKEELLKKNSVWIKAIKPLFKGYVFIRTSIKPEMIADELAPTLERMKGSNPFIRLLHYGDNRKSVAIHEKERIFLEQLFNEDCCIVGSKGFIDDNGVRITEGPLVGLESQIRKIDRHQRRASLDAEFAGDMCEMRLVLEVKKLHNEDSLQK